MPKNSVVTVCITTFNRKEMLNRAVESVLNQTYPHFELIIVDDCSSDGTDKYIETLLKKDKRVRYIRHEINKGLAAARNTAIFNSKGAYFTFVDDDDRWTDNFLGEFVKVADQFESDWCFCCGSITTDTLGQTVYANYESIEGPLIDYIQRGYTPPIASQFYFTSALQKCGGYNENVKNGVDHDLWLTLAFQGTKIKSVDKYLSLPSEALDVSRVKMTNSYHKRITGIAKSLQIWRPQIIAHFGEKYYRHFSEAYISREKKKFFRLYMLSLNIKKAMEVYRDINTDLSIKEVIKSFLIALLCQFHISIKRTKYITRGSSIVIDLEEVIA